MTIKIFMVSISCDNAAYDADELEDSVAENLQTIADEILLGNKQGHVRDYNGNIVGKYFFAETPQKC